MADRLLVSHLTLRSVIGCLGVFLPPALVLAAFVFDGASGLEDTISDYYGGERSRDVFVGVLFTLAWFLFAYKGFERKDDLVGDLGCAFALMVALFPTTSASLVVRAVHLCAAAALFGTFAYFSLALFRKTDESKEPTDKKKMRNKVYLACGIVILVAIALIPVCYLVLPQAASDAIKPVFWLESIALWAFGVSWVTKGEALAFMRDSPA